MNKNISMVPCPTRHYPFGSPLVTESRFDVLNISFGSPGSLIYNALSTLLAEQII